MEDLSKYERQFDTEFPRYTKEKYDRIRKLVESYSSLDASILNSEEFAGFIEVLRPLIAVKNYKTQIPFPEDPKTIIQCCIAIKNVIVNKDDVFASLTPQFEELIEQPGFQLPTVSAILHFSHPEAFPIVDVNVEHSCQFLYKENEQDFPGLKTPKLPLYIDSKESKLQKYKHFIKFLDQVLALQRAYCPGQIDYRFLDKALMVLGDQEKKKKIASKRQLLSRTQAMMLQQ